MKETPKDQGDMSKQIHSLLSREGLTKSSFSEICEHILFPLSSEASYCLYSNCTSILSQQARPCKEEVWWYEIFGYRDPVHINEASGN